MSPSLSSNRNKWALPTNPDPVGVRCICVPVPDDEQWIAKFYGALYQLSQQIWWDRDSAHTAIIVARRWQQVYLDTLAGDCMADDCDDCLGRLRYNPATRRIGFYPDGSIDFFEVADGPWVNNAPTYPLPQPQVGVTDDDKRCIASRNAALVLQQFYRETVLIIAEPGINAVLSIVEYFAEALVLYLGGGFALDFLVSAARQIVEEALLFDADWTDDENVIVQNILYCASAVDEEGVVTFDYDEVIAELGLSLLPQLNAAQQLLIAFMGEDGLNVAGGIHNEDAADCSDAPCVPQPWCYEWNWLDGFTHGWTIHRGTPTASFGIVRVQEPSGGQSRVSISRTLTIPAGSTLEEVCTTYNFVNGSAASVRWVRWGGTVISELNGTAGERIDCDPGLSIVGPATALVEIILDDTWFDQIYLIGFQMSGTGVEPTFTDGAVC